MPPLYFIFLKTIISDDSFFYKVRFLSTLFSVFTFFFLIKIANFWLDWSKSIFISSITLFGSDLFLNYTYEARPYSLCLMLVTIFCFLILRHEIKQKVNTGFNILLGLVCFLLPAVHYTYGISSLFLGSFHILFTNKNRKSLICIYFSAGLFFVASHLNLFLKQQNFGNRLMMIDYPSNIRIIEYLNSFFPTYITLIFLFLIIFVLIKYSLNYNKNIHFIAILSVSFFLILIFGIFMARFFPNNIWFLPRYYLGAILILPFGFIFLFFNIKLNHRKLKVLLPILSIMFICANLYSYRSHRVHIYNNSQLYCYSYYPDKTLDEYKLPIITDDPVLFFHYLLYNNNTYFLTNSKKEKLDFQNFIPDHYKNIIHSVNYNSFIYITTNYNKFKFENYSNKDLNISLSPIHLAKVMHKI